MDYSEIDEEIAAVAAAQVIRMVEAGAVPGAQGDSPDAVVEGIILGLAMVIEQAPQCQTPRALWRTGETYGKLLHQYAKQFREAFEETGIHPISRMRETNGERHTGPSKLN